jgi:HK97 family phage major capsid protein
VPIVETDALTAGTALVGDFSKAVLFDRQSLRISLGTVNDQFIRNLVAVLGEIRAGFGVIRPRRS